MKEVGVYNITNDDNFDFVGYLLNAASLNDSLLQSYRSFHLTLQSIFIAIGSGLLVAMFFLDNTFINIAVFVVLSVIFIVSIYVLCTMKKIMKYRGIDVSWWHGRIIKAENALNPNKRCFTKFKFEQKKHRKKNRNNSAFDELEKKFFGKEMPSDKDIKTLIGEGLGHTRKILDLGLFVWFLIIWILLLIIGIGRLTVVAILSN